MNTIALIQHAGSGNHGCEAIVDSLVRMLPEEKFTLVTNSREEDERYLPPIVKERLNIRQEQRLADHVFCHTVLYAYRKISGDKESFLRYRFAPITGKEAGTRPALAIGIGGDNYCYPEMQEDLILTNSMLHHQGTKTILLGCSIEPYLMKDKRLVADLCSYERITTRESITYKALLAAGIPKDKVILCPDPAFTLPADTSGLPEVMKGTTTENSHVIGMNLSPMVENYASDKNIALTAFSSLIRHILATTNDSIALIPHVVWDRSNDFIPLRKLQEEFKETGRVFLLEDQPAEQLKGAISHCRLMIAARTHASIAAYSSMVPTLVLGYSVKARGIAQDLFGTDDHYVLPVQQLHDPQQLIDAYDWLIQHEEDVRKKLAKKIPQMKQDARINASVVREMRVRMPVTVSH